MKTLRVAACFVPVLLAYLVCDIVADAGRLGPRELFAIMLRLLFWLLPLPLTLAVVQRVTANIRHDVIDAAATVLICTLSALVSDLLFVALLSRLGPPRYMYIRPSLTLIQIARIVLRFVDPPVILAMAIAARWLASRTAERDQAVHAAVLKTRLAEARLQLLRWQLRPHFLFNSLNSIAALIRTDAAGAADMLGRLRRFYSVAGAASDRLYVTLGEELSLVREYLAIEQIRFGARLTVSIDADSLEARVPSLLLQPLVENAVKHGVSRTPGNGFVRIETKHAGKQLRIVIENRADGSGQATFGIGLANTRARLDEMYGTAASLALINDEQRFRVTLMIPEAA